MTLILATIVVPLALVVGLVGGRRRGAVAGFALGFGVLAAGVVGYIGLVTMTMSM